MRIMHPHLKCVVESHPNGHMKYYPIELLEIVDEMSNDDWTAKEKPEGLIL